MKSHVKHHPEKQKNEADEDEEEQMVNHDFFPIHLLGVSKIINSTVKCFTYTIY